MSYLLRACEALEVVRGRLGQNTATNKPTLAMPGGDPLAEEEARIKRKLLSGALDKFRAEYGFPYAAPATRKQILAYGSQVTKRAELANCMELASAAAVQLDRGMKSLPWDLVTIGAGDHVFAIVGSPPLVGNKYPADFRTWPEDAAICDVWADIACTARDFPARWRERMSSWSSMRRFVGTGAGPVDARSWSDLVDGDKTSFTATAA